MIFREQVATSQALEWLRFDIQTFFLKVDNFQKIFIEFVSVLLLFYVLLWP